MSKQRKSLTIDSFFKRKESESSNDAANGRSPALTNPSINEEPQLETVRCDVNAVDISNIERDPGKRPKIWDYPPNKRDQIRQAYLKLGPCQIRIAEYPKSGKKHFHRFQESWYTQFSSWLEYSPSEDAVYCLPCYLFTMKVVGRPGWDVFSVKGFKSWKKVNNGKHCAFLIHIGDDSLSPHNRAVQACEDLLNQ